MRNKVDKKGGRALTQAEIDRLDRGAMPVSERINIMNAPEPGAAAAMPRAPPAAPRAPPAAPYIAPRAAPAARVPPVAAAPVTSIPQFPSYLQQIDKLRRENEYRNTELSRIYRELDQERRMRRNLEYDMSMFNTLYKWGLGLIPSYYSEIQKRRLYDVLKSVVHNELSVNTPIYQLQNLIRKAIEDDLELVSPENINVSISVKKKKAAPSKKKKASPIKKSQKKKTTRKSKKSSSHKKK